MIKRTFVMLAVLLVYGPAAAQEAPHRYAVLIGGLGGNEEYSARFQRYLADTRRALVEEAGFAAEDVIVLAETKADEQVQAVSSAENIREQFRKLGTRVTEDDMLLVILFGHGSFDGKNAQLNIPQRDLNATDYAALLDALPASRQVFINTASSSGPFAQSLAREGRLVITATRTGTQRNETVFPRFLIEALSASGDLDRDGNLSAREIFSFAAERTKKYYEDLGNIATEDATLEDDGDGKAIRLQDLDGGSDGNLASVTYLARRQLPAALTGAAGRELFVERERLERAIADLKSQKTSMTENDYYARLEDLLVQLARLNERIDAAGNEAIR